MRRREGGVERDDRARGERREGLTRREISSCFDVSLRMARQIFALCCGKSGALGTLSGALSAHGCPPQASAVVHRAHSDLVSEIFA